MKKKISLKPHEFVSAGVACYALSLLDNFGLIDILLEKGKLSSKDYNDLPNQAAIQAALVTLVMNNVLKDTQKNFSLNAFGLEVIKQRGLIGLIFDGYRYVFSNQVQYALNKPTGKIDSKAIAKSSIHFGEQTVDPLVIKIIKKLKIKGSICDLGCGAATRLIKLCEMTGYPGLGIDGASGALKLAKAHIKNTKDIQVKKGDLTNLKGLWPDVEVVMQFFVMHDITPSERCHQMLDSYKKIFPHMKYFIYSDIVRPSTTLMSQLPGFDYIHGLLGIHTRTYEETIAMFKATSYEIFMEEPIDGLPNTFIWVLKAKR